MYDKSNKSLRDFVSEIVSIGRDIRTLFKRYVELKEKEARSRGVSRRSIRCARAESAPPNHAIHKIWI